MKTILLIIIGVIIVYYLLYKFFVALVSANGKDCKEWSSEREHEENMLNRELARLDALMKRESHGEEVRQDIAVTEHNIYLLRKRLLTYEK